MTYSRFDWHGEIKDGEREYQAAQFAVDRLRDQAKASPDILIGDGPTPKSLGNAACNLEGTYLVRLFAVFEPALRSYERWRHNDPYLSPAATALIDATGSDRKIADNVRAGAHAVRRLRNARAHQADEESEPLTLAEARSRLARFLGWLPNKWE